MNKYFFSIIVLLLCLLASRPAEARLTLGVVIDPAAAESGGLSRDQVNSLARLLDERLQDTISVKELPDSATLVNWLDPYAAIDMALLPSAEIAAYKGRFLLIGPLDRTGRFTLVARQGVSGGLAERAAALVRESGFAPWRVTVTEEPPPLEDRTGPPPTIDTVIAAQLPPEVDAADSAERVAPVERGRSDVPLPAEAPQKTRLVLAVVPSLGGALKTTAQAEELAAYLGSVLPVAIQVKSFDAADTFAEWFMRYRMIDLAVVVPGYADAHLGRDYRPLVGLSPAGAIRDDVSDLFVARHDLDPGVAANLQAALLGMSQSAAGQDVLARLPVGQITDRSAGVPPSLPEAVPAVAEEIEVPPGTPEEVAATVPEVIEYADPVKPEAPVALAVPAVPTLPEARVPGVLPPEPASPDLIPSLPVEPRSPASPDLQEAVAVTVPPPAPAGLEAATPPALPELAALPVPVPVAALAAAVPAAPSLPPSPAEEPVAPVDVQVVPPTAPEPVPPPVDVQVVLPTAPEPVPPPAAVPTVLEPPAEVAVALDVTEPVPAEEVAVAIPEEIMQSPEPVPPGEVRAVSPVVDDGLNTLKDDDIIALLGEDSVAAIVSQPDIPQELRPPGVPVLRPGRVAPPVPAVEEGLLLVTPAKPIEQKEPLRPPQLLPKEEPEPGIVYIIPFVSVMVPKEVSSRVFDQFVDGLIGQGSNLNLQFVILKEGLQRVDPAWLAVRKYVTGELYAYVEEKGSTATDLRSKARLVYYRPYQETPGYSFEYPVTMFFDNDQSTIEAEREKLSDNIATALTSEFIKALQN